MVAKLRLSISIKSTIAAKLYLLLHLCLFSFVCSQEGKGAEPIVVSRVGLYFCTFFAFLVKKTS